MGQEQLIISRKPLSPSKNKTQMDSDDLLARIRKLDIAALTLVHERYYPDVYRYVFFRLADQQTSEDISSDVFIRLLEALKRGSGPETNLRAWLLGVASNLVNDHLRIIYDRPHQELESIEDFPSSDDPAKAFERSWQNAQLLEAIQQLTPEQQNVIALRFAAECSIEETANQMKRSVNAVKVLQFRAVAALRRLLEGKHQL